jgi:membrane protein implicated in regulation of membrane protease activity
VKIADTVWRAVSDDTLTPGDTVVIDAVDGATLKVKRA